jgi:phosphate-selective porin OprO/OprP
MGGTVRSVTAQQDTARTDTTRSVDGRASFSADRDGFWLRAADGKFALHLGGYIQADSRTFLDDAAGRLTNTFLLRRVRPLIEGTVFQYFDYRILPDWGGGSAVLQDGYVVAKVRPYFKLQAGKFKGPVGLERLQSATDIMFIERAFPSAIAPNRDLGFALTGDIADSLVHYDLGIFDGVVDGASLDTDPGDDKDVDGRLYVSPFKRSSIRFLSGLSVGVAGTIGSERGTQAASSLASYRTPGQNTFFSYRSDTTAVAAVADGRRWRISPQAYWRIGRVGLLGEWIHSSQEMSRGTATTTVGVTAWQAAGSFALTGENASYRGLSPKRPLTAKGYGAFEVVARYSKLVVDDDAFPTFADPARSARKAKEWAVGLNWYAERRLKIGVNYGQTEFDGGAAGGADRTTEKALLTRFQVAF